MAKQHQVSASIIINSPTEQAWLVLRDFDNVHEWAPTVTESYGIGNKELGVGHGRHCKIKGFGGLDEYITEWSEGKGFDYTVSPVGPLNNATSQWRIDEQGDGQTRLNISLNYETRWGIFGKLMHALMMRSKLKASLNQTVNVVKARVEALSAEDTSGLAAAS
jgi:uncharacterized membrane protein